MKRHPHEKAVGIVDKMEEMSTRAERSDWVLCSTILGSGNIKIRIMLLLVLVVFIIILYHHSASHNRNIFEIKVDEMMSFGDAVLYFNVCMYLI